MQEGKIISDTFSKNRFTRLNSIELDLHKIQNLEVFRVTHFESGVKLRKSKMGETNWRTKIEKYNSICMKFGIWEFFGALISN